MNSKLITIVTSYPFPGFAATSNRILSFAKGLNQNKSFNVKVVGPGADKFINLETQISDLEIIDINKPNYSGRSLLLRAVNEIRSSYKLFLAMSKTKPDILIISIPSIFLLMLILFKKQNTLIVTDIRDLVWEYLLKKNYFYRLVGKILRKISLFLIKKSDLVTVTNNSEKEKLSKKGVEAEIIYNGLDSYKFKKLIENQPIKSSNMRNRINITYAGNIGFAQKLDVLIKASKNIKHINVNIIGNGKDSERLKKYISMNRIKNIKIIDAMNFDSILKYYCKTDIFYVQIGKEFSTALPSKIFEFLATGKNLLLSVPPGPATKISKIFSGIFIIEPENAKALQEKLLNLSLDDLIQNKKNIDLIRSKFLREDQALILSKMIKNLIKK